MSDVKIESGTPEMVALKLYYSLVVELPSNKEGEETINSCLKLYAECLKTVQDTREVGKFKIAG